ncbi:MAG: cytochrome c oxidase accessory protein CcoG [Luteibaculaceae bacterium]
MNTTEKEESFRDSIGTIDEEGKRKWITPKKPGGKFTRAREWVSLALLSVLFAGPFIKIDGEPILMLNVLERKFVIFGQIFWPQDFYLFVLTMITGIVFVVLFTVVYGRIFCGWVCPQTIFLEGVFRKIEYAIDGDWKQQQKLRKQPWDKEKITKRAFKHSIYFGISFLIANTFLAYIIGLDELKEIVTDNPKNHVAGLVAILVFTLAFYWVFAWFREQVCLIACPYGRLQGVMLDRDSVVVAYDYVRGENRAKFKKNEERSAVGKGDCIDCNACVHVCPTGIDIRNGTQLECINCTACIDACDSMMEAVNLPKGLVRYASEEQIEKRQGFKLTTRAKAYSVVLVVLLGIMSFLLFSRTEMRATVLRTPGMLYQTNENGTISNLYNYKLINKSNRDIEYTFKVNHPAATLMMIGSDNVLPRQGVSEGAIFVYIDKEHVQNRDKIKFEIYNEKGKLIQTVKSNFIGPVN